MYLVPAIGLVFIGINKVASNSLGRAIHAAHSGVEAFPRSQHAEHSELKVAMWREPHERIESAFRMFRPETSFSKFVIRFSEAEAIWDKHLRPQTDFCSWQGRRFVDHVIQWDFYEFARIFATDPIEHRNPSEPMAIFWSAEARKAFDSRFAEDIEIWNKPPTAGKIMSGQVTQNV